MRKLNYDPCEIEESMRHQTAADFVNQAHLCRMHSALFHRRCRELAKCQRDEDCESAWVNRLLALNHTVMGLHAVLLLDEKQRLLANPSTGEGKQVKQQWRTFAEAVEDLSLIHI